MNTACLPINPSGVCELKTLMYLIKILSCVFVFLLDQDKHVFIAVHKRFAAVSQTVSVIHPSYYILILLMECFSFKIFHMLSI